ncbi:hypothetical protein [Croceicoccus sp. Ery5]|uniref:hypothetical protein n=1 Tax=Croceicoccus sp. Ery5 TaxID=1703340 RepID=UPI001E40589B|nr:hypothetical protein [Croceicoccus sp. Ery5]
MADEIVMLRRANVYRPAHARWINPPGDQMANYALHAPKLLARAFLCLAHIANMQSQAERFSLFLNAFGASDER